MKEARKEMLICEENGFCPVAHLSKYDIWYPERTSKLWRKTKRILMDRMGYMVYAEHGTKPQDMFIIDVLVEGEGTLGIEIATALKVLIPECIYGEIGRPIVMTDYPDTSNVPSSVFCKDGDWFATKPEILIPSGKNCGKKAKLFVFHDTNFLVILMDDGDKVYMHIHKINP